MMRSLVLCAFPKRNEYARISMTTRMMWMMPPVRFVFFFSLSLSPFCRRPRKTFDSHLIFSSLSLLPYRYYLKQPQRLQSLPVGNAERAQRRLAKKSAHMPARSDVTAAKHHAGKRVGGINNNFNNKRSE